MRSPARPGSRCARCNGSGGPTASSRTESAPSSARTTPPLPRRWRMWLASIWTSRPMQWCSHSTNKRQIQALERTRPDLPLAPGHPAAQTHDYTRHGTTTLFAALDVLHGTVIGRCMQQHRHGEFIHFLNAVEANVPDDKCPHRRSRVSVRHSPNADDTRRSHRNRRRKSLMKRGLRLRHRLQSTPGKRL